jgi:predicted AlkP superfamily phosphohydrolase/phosphomutase
VLYLNRALAELGFLRFKARPSELDGRLKAAALGRLPPRLRERAFRFGGTLLPSWLEGRVRFGAIDMRHTRAFSDELNYFPAIYLNQRGREPQGIVAPRERETTLASLSEALLDLRDPADGARLVTRVMRREQLFSGPALAQAPDLLLELALVRGYSVNLQPSASARAPGIVSRLESSEFLGKKGRSLPGSHRPHGLFIAAGPRVAARGRIELGIEDAAVSVLARMGLARPGESRGVAMSALLADAAAPLPALAQVAPRAQSSSEVIARLRALGYVD